MCLPGNGVPLELQVIESRTSVDAQVGVGPLHWVLGLTTLQSVNCSLAENSTSFAVCPDGHVSAAHCELLVENGIVTVVLTVPFFGCTSWDVLALLEVVFFAEALVQLPPPPAQAQSRLIVALPITQRSVCPRPLTSTSTPNGAWSCTRSC